MADFPGLCRNFRGILDIPDVSKMDPHPLPKCARRATFSVGGGGWAGGGGNAALHIYGMWRSVESQYINIPLIIDVDTPRLGDRFW